MSLRQMFEGIECPRFGSEPALITKTNAVDHKNPVVTKTQPPKSKKGGRPRLPEAERLVRRAQQIAARNAKRKASVKP